MITKKYQSVLVSVENPIDGIYTLEFKSLSGRYKYNPGQFLHLALDQEYDGSGQWPDSRCFSMQSEPMQETIKITYAVKGKFTLEMHDKLKPGSEIWLKLPYGDLFTQPHNKVNTVFIAGGTGITPFLSLFNHVSFREYVNPKIYLGFRTKAFNIYINTLNNLTSPVTRIFYEDSDGPLNIGSIYDENGWESSYFISGPPVMIKSFKQFLTANGIPENQILTDDWE